MLETMSGDFLLVKHPPTLALPRLLDLFKAEDFPQQRPCVPWSSWSFFKFKSLPILTSFAPENSFSFSSAAAGTQSRIHRNRASITFFLVWLCYDTLFWHFFTARICPGSRFSKVAANQVELRTTVLSSVFFLEYISVECTVLFISMF